jgi:hypothetical protein
MSETSPQTRKLLAGVAAVVLTLGAAGAAVAVNLGTGAAVETPAGRLAATEPIGTTPSEITPSTIYVDLTVPVPTESTAAPAPAAPSQGGAAAEGTAVPRDDSWDDESDDDAYDHGDDEDHDRDEDHDEDHEEGADDDD